MSWPASTQRLDDALASVDRAALEVAGRAASIRNASLAGPISRYTPIAFVRDLTNAIAAFNAAAAVPGIVQYARDQKGDQGIDVVAEFTAMRDAAQALKDWVANNFPVDAGSGAVLIYSHDGDGNLVELTFTTAQLGGFRTQLDAFIATVS